MHRPDVDSVIVDRESNTLVITDIELSPQLRAQIRLPDPSSRDFLLISIPEWVMMRLPTPT